MKIINTQVYGIKESFIRSGYPMQTGEPVDMSVKISEQDLKRVTKLASAKQGSGHDNFLKGIIVQFDLQYPQYLTPQLQRYNWIDIVSSQSKMHRLTSVKSIQNNCNIFVLGSIINEINILISLYNEDNFPSTYIDYSEEDVHINSKEDCFKYIISNLPMGYELWMGITTNYLQLKTIYKQRKTHKLDEWKYICNWVETLPYSYLITQKE